MLAWAPGLLAPAGDEDFAEAPMLCHSIRSGPLALGGWQAGWVADWHQWAWLTDLLCHAGSCSSCLGLLGLGSLDR
jgi:hypothetical protein